MKKKLFILAAMLMCITVAATAQPQAQPQQERTPEEKMQNRAENMAAKLLLSDQDAAKFVPVYMEYLKDFKAVNEKYKPNRPKDADGQKVKMTDKDIEAQLRAQLAKSQEILDVRKAYLDKYLKVISARQVRELYKIEKEQQQQHMKKPGDHGSRR